MVFFNIMHLESLKAQGLCDADGSEYPLQFIPEVYWLAAAHRLSIAHPVCLAGTQQQLGCQVDE